MRSVILIVAVPAAVAISGDALAQSAGRFDGTWTTLVACPKAGPAGSFTFLVDADVKGGVFNGEKGDKGKPGWFLLNGKVQSDGAVEIFARGIVNSKIIGGGERSLGHGIRLSVTGRLEGSKGIDARVGGRPCKVTSPNSCLILQETRPRRGDFATSKSKQTWQRYNC